MIRYNHGKSDFWGHQNIGVEKNFGLGSKKFWDDGRGGEHLRYTTGRRCKMTSHQSEILHSVIFEVLIMFLQSKDNRETI